MHEVKVKGVTKYQYFCIKNIALISFFVCVFPLTIFPSSPSLDSFLGFQPLSLAFDLYIPAQGLWKNSHPFL